MRSIFIMLIFIVHVSVLNASVKIGILSGVVRPDLIEINDNTLFIVEGAQITAFKLDSLKEQHVFCKAGEGPGEIKCVPSIVNYLVPVRNNIMIVGMDKAIEFSKEGQLIKEFKIPAFTNYLYPLKKGYLGMRLNHCEDGKSYLVLGLLSDSYKMKKELFRQQMSGMPGVLQLPIDRVNIALIKDTLFIENSNLDFEILRFAMTGQARGKISRSLPAIPFTEELKTEAMNHIRNNREVRALGWKRFKFIVKFRYGQYVPLVQDMQGDDRYLYVKIHRKHYEQEVDTYLVLKPNGREVTEIQVPQTIDCDYADTMFSRPARFGRFYKGCFYYVKENELSENWELFKMIVIQ